MADSEFFFEEEEEAKNMFEVFDAEDVDGLISFKELIDGFEDLNLKFNSD